MPDRTLQPQTVLPDNIAAATPRKISLPNGPDLYYIHAGTQEVLRISLIFNAGTRHQSEPFIASTMLNMLSEGTANMTAMQIAEHLDFYGIYYDASIDRDYSVITISCLNRFLEQTLELLGELVFRPIFPADKLEIYKTKRRQALAIERQKVAYRAREVFAEALFGPEHPYGIYSDVAMYDNVMTDKLQQFYNQSYRDPFAVVSGYVTDREVGLISDFLSGYGKVSTLKSRSIAVPVKSVGRVTEHRDEAVQSALRVGRVMFGKEHPDYNGMQVLATVLGGYFGSRLVANLREDKGYTYGIFSTMVNLECGGYFAVATEVAAEHTEAAVAEIILEIERMRTDLVAEEELQMVKNTIAGEIMRILDGPFGIADVTIENIQSGEDNAAVGRFFDEVMAITPERIRELAQKYLNPADLTTVIVGCVHES